MSSTSPETGIARSSPLMMLVNVFLSDMGTDLSVMVGRARVRAGAWSGWQSSPEMLLGASSDGFWSKKPNGLSQKETMSTGIIGQSSTRVMWWMPKTYQQTTSVPTSGASSSIHFGLCRSRCSPGSGSPPPATALGVVLRSYPERVPDDRSSLVDR